MRAPARSAAFRTVRTCALLAALLACDEEGACVDGERFCRVAPEIVIDTQTELQWRAEEEGGQATWAEARRRCRGIGGAGRGGWRLPTIDELSNLYDPDVVADCAGEPCGLAAPIRLTSPYVWSASESGPDRRFYFDFRFGTRLSPRLRPELTRQVLCAR